MTGAVAERTPQSFAFGSFVLIPERQLLLKGQTPVRIGSRALDILTALVEKPGEVVSKRELIERVWPDTIVEEGNLKVNMAALRRALGEGPNSDPYIATVVGRGYRFVLPVRRNGSQDLPPDESIAPRSHNLPNATVRIVGRSDAINAIRDDLAGARLVSIVGAGGIGKTTVAIAIAEMAATSFRDGVWLVELAPLKNPALVPDVIATAIGLAAHSANMLAALCGYLRDREMLLLFDSCEHMIDAVAACTDQILASAAGVRVLATSREPLRVKGERVRRLPGLVSPPDRTPLNAAAAVAFSAVELFVERASDRLESFKLTDGDAPMVAEICRRLDGLALAIELAATRVDAFGVRGLLDQLGDRFDVLEGNRGGPERHRTLTTAIDWSYDLLLECERATMRRLATFAGAFSRASAQAVAAEGSIDGSKVLDQLAKLVAKSLVATEVRGSEIEYRLLDTTRSYALQKLEANGELGDARRRHAEHFLALAERAKADGERLGRGDWHDRYAAKIDDIRDALNWAFANAGAHALGVRLTVAAIPFWERLSLLEECRVAVERALDDRFRAHRGEHEASALHLALGAALMYTRGPVPEVKTTLVRALELAERNNDTDRQLECLSGLSEYELWTGDTRSSIAVADKLRTVALANGHAEAGANADAPTGSALRYLGDLAGSQRHLENIIDRPIARDDHAAPPRFEFDQRLAALGSLASVLWLRGFPDQALAMARRQREEAEASHHAVSLCSAIIHTTVGIALFVRDVEEAGRMLDFIEKHAAEHHLTVWRAMATCMRGRWLLDCGKPFQVAAFRDAANELYEAGLRMRYPSYLANLGEGLAQQGDVDGAHACFDEAISLSKSGGQLWGIPEILRMKGNLIRRDASTGSRKAAAGYYRESIEWARRQGALSWELRSAISLVELEWDDSADEAPKELLASAYGRFCEGFGTGDLRTARSLLTAARQV